MTRQRTAKATDVATHVRPLAEALLGPAERWPVGLRCWDDSRLGPVGGTTIVLRSPDALRRLFWAPDELGLVRAHVAGELDIEGDVFDVLALRELVADPDAGLGMERRAALRAAAAVGALGPPLRAPPEEARVNGRRHSKQRDADAVRHHYDIGNDFYSLFLGDELAYSCAYFDRPDASLDEAQRAKFELICRKLGLRPGMRILDVGCGWGGFLLHAARHHGVVGVGVTLSPEQQALAVTRLAEAGLADAVEVRLADERDIDDGPYDAIASIGMFEHVGRSRLADYATHLHALLGPTGRLLNHGISRPPGPSAIARDSFAGRYVFPDGELHEVGVVVSVLQEAGFEVRDVQSLREHYARTLRCWVANLEARWDQAVALVGSGRARVWRLYMAGSALGFEAGRTSIHQVLAVRPDAAGASGMPTVRPT